MPAKTSRQCSIMAVFGTRPEAIKLAPIVKELESRPEQFHTINVITSQHTDLIEPFLEAFEIRVDHDLHCMRKEQNLNSLISKIIVRLDRILESESPQLILVQGDTTSALAGALVGFHRRIPVAHVEAGLRSGNPMIPFPEETNRRLISTLGTFHFAPTQRNLEALLAEGVPIDSIAVTGNPVVDALRWILTHAEPSVMTRELIASVSNYRLVVVTTHRRENLGPTMRGQLSVLRDVVRAHKDLAVIFPVHSNPAVRKAAMEVLSGTPRIRLVAPLGYKDFIHLMAHAWLIVSDSGGIQEEVPSLGKPLLVLREVTERPEAIECGAARLVGHSADRFRESLEECLAEDSWIKTIPAMQSPFGEGDSAKRIVDATLKFLDRGHLPSAARHHRCSDGMQAIA